MATVIFYFFLLTLDFFAKNPPPFLDINTFDLPFVVGSGNAYNTGLILFSEKAAIFADESNFKKIQYILTGVLSS